MLMKILRPAVGVLLLIALFYFGLIDIAELRRALAHPIMLVAATIVCAAVMPVAGLRWHLFLRSQGLVLRLSDTVRIVTMSFFFATFLPGGAGGDIVRGVYIYDASHGRRTGALLSIFIDRLIGLFAFMLVGVLATLSRPWQSFGLFEYGVFLLAIAFLISIGVLFKFGHRIAGVVNLLFRGRSRRLAEIIDAAGTALHQYGKEWRSVILCLLLSIVIVFLLAAGVVMIAETMQFGSLSVVEYGIAGIYAMIANVVPVSPGGLGIGEGAFASACIALEPTMSGVPYGTIFLVFRCVSVISSLPGLIVYLIYPHRAKLLTVVNPPS